MQATENHSSPQPMTVLIVDDDGFTRVKIKQMLTEALPVRAYVFHEADWGREAIQMLENQPYDCVFLDCNLKDFDALMILQRLYDSEIGMCASPIVLMTSQGKDHMMIDAFRLGAEDYLLKEALSPVTIGVALTKARNVHRLRRDRHRTERELAYMRKMEAIGQLTSGVAHDFNNLLGAVMGNITQLRRRLDDGTATLSVRDIAAKIEAIEKVSQHGSDLIKRLMMFTRQVPLHQEVTSPNTCVKDTIALLDGLLSSNVSIEADLQTDLWSVLLDKGEFQNVLINFAVNARDAMQNGGTLTISTENCHVDVPMAAAHRGLRPGSYVVLTISDTGSGMNEETMTRIFEPFFTTKPAGIGTGLGMSMAYGFIKESGGYVQVKSKEGEGTSFRLYLPRATSNDAERIASQRDKKHA